METLDILAFIDDFAPKHLNSCLWLYVDNNHALAAIVRGDSPTDIVDIAVSRIWGPYSALTYTIGLLVSARNLSQRIYPFSTSFRPTRLGRNLVSETPMSSLSALVEQQGPFRLIQ